MSDTFDVVEVTLGSAVANGGTFTAGYPSGREADDYINAGGNHKIASNNYGLLTARGGDFTISFGATYATITNATGASLAAGTKLFVQLDRIGQDGAADVADPVKMTKLEPYFINLGTPITADPNGYVESQDLTAAGVFSVNTTAAAAIAAAALDGEADVPRNVVAGWTGTAILTVTGEDVDGNPLVESSGSGTSLAGKKAFKRVTGISSSANITSLTVGTGDVLGLPVFLPSTGRIVKELQDGAAATAGTPLAGVTTSPATASTGDVRGTYDPNAAADGSKAFALIVMLDDPSYKGVAQYGG